MLLKDIWEQHLVPLLKMHEVTSSQLAYKTSACVSWAHKLKVSSFDRTQRELTKVLCTGLACQSRNTF